MRSERKELRWNFVCGEPLRGDGFELNGEEQNLAWRLEVFSDSS